MQPHTRRRRHGISHHPHSSAFALVRARSRSTTLFCFLSGENALSEPTPSSHPLSFPISLFSASIRPKPLVYSRGSAKSSAQTLLSHLVRTDARVCTKRSSNLLIAIEQLSDGKLSYSCSLGPFPCNTFRSGPSCILSLYVFTFALLYASLFKLLIVLQNCIEPDIRDKAYCR